MPMIFVNGAQPQIGADIRSAKALAAATGRRAWRLPLHTVQFKD